MSLNQYVYLHVGMYERNENKAFQITVSKNKQRKKVFVNKGQRKAIRKRKKKQMRNLKINLSVLNFC